MRRKKILLTNEQQLKLRVLMRNKGVNQIMIAKINGLPDSKRISDVCLGKTGVTPLYKKRFLNAGIDLDIILNSDEEIIPTRMSYFNKFKEPRALTYREQNALYKIMKKRHIISAQISKRLGYKSDNALTRIRNGTRKVDSMVVKAFLDEGINLNTLL